MPRRPAPGRTVLEFGGRGGRPLTVLCLGAHADDIEIGCGGTLLTLARRSPRMRMSWVVFSGTPVRAAEARQSGAAWLGGGRAAVVTTHAFRESYFPAEFAMIKDEMQALAARLAPDLVLTHSRADRHQDHRVISDLTWNAFRDSTILEYEIPKWDGDLGAPNLFQPVSRVVLERKLRLLNRHFKSQRAKDWFDPATFRGLARVRGMECRSPSGFAEAFYARKLTLAPG